MTPMWPAAKMASKPWSSSSNNFKNFREWETEERSNDENPDLNRVASRGRHHPPVCTWLRLRLASEWGSWRWDGGPSPPADPWGDSCRGHGEETCEPTVWWCQWGDWRPGPWGTPGEDYKKEIGRDDMIMLDCSPNAELQHQNRKQISVWTLTSLLERRYDLPDTPWCVSGAVCRVWAVFCDTLSTWSGTLHWQPHLSHSLENHDT